MESRGDLTHWVQLLSTARLAHTHTHARMHTYTHAQECWTYREIVMNTRLQFERPMSSALNIAAATKSEVVCVWGGLG